MFGVKLRVLHVVSESKMVKGACGGRDGHVRNGDFKITKRLPHPYVFTVESSILKMNKWLALAAWEMKMERTRFPGHGDIWHRRLASLMGRFQPPPQKSGLRRYETTAEFNGLSRA